MTSNINSEGIARLAKHYLERRQAGASSSFNRKEAHSFLQSRLGAYDIGGDAIDMGIDQYLGGGSCR